MKTKNRNAYLYVIKKLKKARIEAGLTQDEVAKHLKVYMSYISKIEHGDRRVDIIELAQLSKLYGKPITYFIQDSE
jgi:transcriptional regulator with XRE-family HTH domain